MRYLGIDYGEKNVGIAVSDEDGKIAFAREVLRITVVENAIADICGIIEREGIKKIIIGLPLSAVGARTFQTAAVEAFAASLSRKIKLPIELQNEILSSRQAERQGVSKKTLDSAAAALILQSYLDKIADRI